MINKKHWIAPIPGTRKIERLIENAGASDIFISEDEVKKIDTILDNIEISSVFGGSNIVIDKKIR